ncbi:MAG: SpvB/TcaC N-terminal domain-containing protein [Nitrospirota bacterium]
MKHLRGYLSVLLFLLLFITATVYAFLSPDNIKVTPFSVSSPDSTEDAAVLFDRDTTTVYNSPSSVVVDLDLQTEVRGIKVFGPAPYSLSVQAEVGGLFSPVNGLQGIDLSQLAEGWYAFSAATGVATNRLRLDLAPVSGSSAVGLKAIEIWGAGGRMNIKNSAALLSALLGASPPQNGRLYIASPQQGVIGGISDDVNDNTFSFTINRNPIYFKRVYLAYQSLGLSHYVQAVRSINGGVTQGGFILPSSDTWSTQIEEINPQWLNAGQNQIAFSAPSNSAGTYTIKDVYLVAELESGVNFVATVNDNMSDPLNPAANLIDGDINTGWIPYPSGNAISVDAPTLQFTFDKPTQIDGLAFYLSGALKGSLSIEFLKSGIWSSSAVSAIDGKNLNVGWNSIAAKSSGAADGLRLSFSGGKGSSAELRELQSVGSGVGRTWDTSHLTISFPDAGQYYGRTAYIRGFLQPIDNGSGLARIYIAGKEVSSVDGAFESAVSKDDVGLSSQGDSEPWSVEVKAIYLDGQTVTTTITLNNYQPAVESTANKLLPAYNISIPPGQAKKINYDAAGLDIGADALSAETTISIQPIGEDDLPKLDTGMTNVTKGPRRGYRFLPLHMKFNSKIKVTLPYNKALIPPGHTEQDIKTFYFDDQAGSWKELERAAIDTQAQTVTSLTDHFTDMINATVTVPDHPQAVSFNPTQIKDIKAADPGSQINLIEPPRANNTGDARLSYPIEIPPGRNGLQPQLAVQYNSSGGNGWMGIGWDIPIQSITIDTRWGVPRYDAAKETETYLLNGEQLTPAAHRGELVPRTSEKIFKSRVEGQFRKIIRHGDNPKNYSWEVIDKNGVKYIYGGLDSTLSDNSGNIFLWALTEVRDTNNNFIRYRYSKVSDTGLSNGTVAGSNIYLSNIAYTGSGASDGPYQVAFIRDRELNEPKRADVQIDARGGFKRVTADLLRRIDVAFSNDLIRSYKFEYQEAAFKKSLLKTVIQTASDGITEFNRHTFAYYDEIREDGGAYNGFAGAEDWNTGGDSINTATNLLNSYDISALGGAFTANAGGHLYLGFNLLSGSKNGSFGGKFGHNISFTEGLLALMDINGDSLPDKVYKSDKKFYFRLNRSGPNGGISFDSPREISLPGQISKESSQTLSAGPEFYVFPDVIKNLAETFTTGSTYFSDANGDGLPDLIKNGQVYFNYLENGAPKFDTDSSISPVPVGPGAVDATELIEDYEAIYQQNIDRYPLSDTLRRWVAPYDGQIRITGDAGLIDTSLERSNANYTTADGVRLAIQQNGSELWSTTIAADDYTQKMPTGVDAITVQKGDRIYFRVQSLFDGMYDQVDWNPEITYLNVPADIKDANNLNPYRFKASEDFTLAGRRGINVTMPLDGTVRLTGDLQKNGITTDDVTLMVQKNGATIFTQSIPWDQTGAIPLNMDIDVKRPRLNANNQYEVDSISLRVRVDSPVDVTKIQWAPNLYYISSPDPNVQVTDDQGNYIIQLNPPYDIDIYPDSNLTAPQEPWTATQTGALTVNTQLSVSGADTSGEVIFTVKRLNERAAKRTIAIANGNAQNVQFDIDVTQGDRLYFDFSSYDPALRSKITNSSVEVTYDTIYGPWLPVPSALHNTVDTKLYPQAYRGWAFAGYNGNRGRASQPVNEGLLTDAALEDSYKQQDISKIMAYPFYPRPSKGSWYGPDDHTWVTASSISSSRLGLDYIDVPRPGNFAGGRAVSRLSRTSQNATSLGVFSFSASISGGSSYSLIDYMDMNGDRFPDIVGKGRIQYTTLTGGLEGNNRTIDGFVRVRESENKAWNLGIGGNAASFKANSQGNVDVRAAGGPSKENNTGSQMVTVGFSGGLGKGKSHIAYDLMDINGDGLPDKVRRDGGNIKVSLNLGYSFAGEELWGEGQINDGKSENYSIGGSLGFNSGNYSFGGGLSFSKSDSKAGYTLQVEDVGGFETPGNEQASRALLDINGDGLLDLVLPDGSNIRVNINTGNGFAPEIIWRSSLDKGIGTNESITLGGGFYFTIGIGPICYFGCYIIINPGGDAGQIMTRQETGIRDIDGDGYPDHIYSTKNADMKVARNRTGRTNLLKTVNRPMGGRIDIEYNRSGNTYDMPQSRWVMSKASVYDGFAGDGVDTQVTTYKYENGKYNRLEREFYGYAKVTEEHLNAANNALYRIITREYLNDTFYTKGLLKKELTNDSSARPYIETENTYLLRDVDTGYEPADGASATAAIFPMLIRTDRRFYEGQMAAGKATYTTHRYDTLGNIAYFFDAGDGGASDDVEADIAYTQCPDTYIVGKANSINVKGNGALMRRREANIDCTTGNLTQVRQYLETGQSAVTDLIYYPNGNLMSVTGTANKNNQRYTLTYEYDPVVSTHVTKITDSFGYSSSATHNYRYGKVETTTDLNNNKITYVYDAVGRVSAITGPYEQGTGRTTISFNYNPFASVPYALTQHIDKDANGAIKDPIDTILYTDGLKRVLQTKKDGTIYAGQDSAPSNVMIVSGRVSFDHVGRTTEQYYPITETKGTNTAFNTTFDSITATRMEYDILDRNIRTTIPDGTSTAISYGFGADRTGQMQFETTVTDANNKQKKTYRDVRELITSIKEYNAGGAIWTSYFYDPLKQIIKVIDDKNNTTTITYDNLGRRTNIDNPDTGRTETVYDLSSNVIAKITANLRVSGQQITYDYDYNRLKAIKYPNYSGNNVSYEYGAVGASDNRAGRITKVTDQSGTEERYYGKLGEITKEIKTVVTFTTPNAPEVYTSQYQYDTWGRLQRMTYPDGEVLTYDYDSGGLVKSAAGVKGSFKYDYIKRLEYDKFEQRAFMEAGNNIRTTYSYNAQNRRLTNLKAGKGTGNLFQNLNYGYDNVGNIMSLANNVPAPPPPQFGGPTTQSFNYDDLYRLTSASGTYQFAPDKTDKYTLSMVYDNIHNILLKQQNHEIVQPSGVPITQKKTTYTWNYSFDSSKPHAPTHIGDRTFSYDANGNQLGWAHDQNGTSRSIVWDEENRIQSIFDNGKEKTYKYDDQGQRVIKRGPQGETVYVNQYFVIRNKEIGTKHVYAGTTRVVSKLMKQDKPGANPQGQTPLEKDLYFYHPDHLGSSNYITDTNGSLYEHLEYFPFGETWVEESSNNTQRTPYLFTGKELDPETGLYYFGARYYDPRTSVWQSGDPALMKFLPNPKDMAGSLRVVLNPPYYYPEINLPGRGGIYMSSNLALYQYGHNNPVSYVDPDGNLAFFWHFGITYKAARDSGMGFSASMALAWKTTMVDVGSQSIYRSDTQKHAMAGFDPALNRYQTQEEALQTAHDYMKKSLDEGKLHDAIHGVQDWATPEHRGEEWIGFTWLPIPLDKNLFSLKGISEHLGKFTETWKHILGDVFPKSEVIKEAYQRTTDILVEKKLPPAQQAE